MCRPEWFQHTENHAPAGQYNNCWTWTKSSEITDLDHVMQWFLIFQTETFPDVQHVYLRAGNHDPDKCVVSCPKTLEIKQSYRLFTHSARSKGLGSALRAADVLHYETKKKNTVHILYWTCLPSLTCKDAWQRTWEHSLCTELCVK